MKAKSIIIASIFLLGGCASLNKLPDRYTNFYGFKHITAEPFQIQAKYDELARLHNRPAKRVWGLAIWHKEDRSDCKIWLPPYYTQEMKDHEIAHCRKEIEDYK